MTKGTATEGERADRTETGRERWYSTAGCIGVISAGSYWVRNFEQTSRVNKTTGHLINENHEYDIKSVHY